MNKSYMYANGNIHIFTEKLDKKVIEYKDYFEEELISQNKLEIYNNMMVKNEKDIDNIDLNCKLQPVIGFSKLIGFSGIGYITPYFVNLFCKLDFSYLSANLNDYMLVSTLLGLAFSIPSLIKIFLFQIEELCELRARKRCREKFKNKYLEEKEKYNLLRELDSKLLEEKYKEKRLEKIDLHSEELEKDIIEYFTYNVVYEQFKKYFVKYYKKGILLDNNFFDLERLQKIEEMIEEDIDKQKIKKK